MSGGWRPAVVEAALMLASQGFPCFPCYENKRPTTSNGFKDASLEQMEIQRLWRRHPGPLIGIPTGKLSGLDVLDIDRRDGGREWLIENKARLPETRVHRTRSGGLHFLLLHEHGLRCSAGRIARGVDVRADGGYVIWWPARGFSVLAGMSPAPWPAWLCRRLLPSPRAVTSRIVVPDNRLLTHLIQLVAGARGGERNNLTYWAGCRAGEMVA
jgi:hypothetical protein